MTKHDAVNKLAAAVGHLRMADTLSTQPGVIDEIRKATIVLLDMGEQFGKTLTRRKK